MTRKREVLASEDISDLPPPSHRHPMSGEPIWDQHAVRALMSKLRAEDVQAGEAGENLLDYAMAIAHERELDVTGHKHDSDGAVSRFKSAVGRAMASAPVASPAAPQRDVGPFEAAPLYPDISREIIERNATVAAKFAQDMASAQVVAKTVAWEVSYQLFSRTYISVTNNRDHVEKVSGKHGITVRPLVYGDAAPKPGD